MAVVERSNEEGCNLTHEGNINPSQEKSVARSCFTLQGEVNGNGSSIKNKKQKKKPLISGLRNWRGGGALSR